MKQHDHLKSRAFTLIELLVVVAVILILFGISLKVMSVVNRKTATAKTLYVLEQTRNALDAYFASVGSVPNTTVIKYDRVVGQSAAGFDVSEKLKDFEVRGLSYYLGYESRDRSDSWQKFAKTVIGGVGSHTNPPIVKVGFDAVMTTNSVDSIRDGWGREIVYLPNADCDGYTLYSQGPDTSTGIDDIGIDKNE
jgi:prepilin-type N-terminal cleavage/methylation domain-containing protein